MQATDLTSPGIFPLTPGDSCAFATEMMNEWQLNHLPVVHKSELMGMLCRKDLIEVSPKKKIDDLITPLPFYNVRENFHLFQILGFMGGTGFTLLPVLNQEGHYAGAISLSHLLHLTGQLLTISQEGAIVCLEMNASDYALTEIARFAENDNLKIMGLLINKLNDTGRIQIHLKLNSWQVNRFVGTLSRFNYQVAAVYSTMAVMDDLKSRYDALMKYLET